MCDRERESWEDDKDKDLRSDAELRRRRRAGRGGEVLKDSSHQETFRASTEWKT